MQPSIKTAFLFLAWTLFNGIQAQNSTEYIFETDLGEFYSYAVHLPLNMSQENTPPPAVLYLGGTGSLYVEGQTQTIERVASFGGPGWRLDRYYNGSIDPADVTAAQQFVSIIPVYGAQSDPKLDWDTGAIMDVLANARSKYVWDDSRLYLTSFSKGARTAWPLLIANSSYFAAATIAAGVPVVDVDARDPSINYTGMEALGNIPIIQYAGRQDYENASQVWEHEAVQNYLANTLGFTNVQLQIVENAEHGDMQQAPFNETLFDFLLSNQSNNTNATLTSVSPSFSAASINSAPLSTASAQSGILADTKSTSSAVVLGASFATSLFVAGSILLLLASS